MRAPTKWLKDLVKQIEAAGYEIRARYSEGWVKARMDDEIMFMALEINRSHWCVRAVEGMLTEVES